LAGDIGDEINVGVVVEQCEAFCVRRCREQQVGDLGRSLLATINECCLDLTGM
jgi:hypothetical protein